MDFGVVFITTGPKWVPECIEAAASLKHHNPEVHVSLFTDQEVHAPFFDAITVNTKIPEDISPERWHRDFGQKIFFLSRTPYKHTLYLDTDTLILDDIHTFVETFKNKDLCLAHQAVDKKAALEMNPQDKPWLIRNTPNTSELDYEFPHFFNAGVMLYRRTPKMAQFFTEWWKRWLKAPLKICDQDILNELLFENKHRELGLEFQSFPNKLYNVRPVMIPLMSEEERKEVKIIHCRTSSLRKQIFVAKGKN